MVSLGPKDPKFDRRQTSANARDRWIDKTAYTRLAAPGRVGTNFFFSFFLARSSQRGNYPFRFVTESPKEQKWPTGPQENVLTFTL